MTYFIVNPIAGKGRAQARTEEINAHMTGDFRVVMTTAPKHAKELAEQAVREGAKTVVAVGGDGTIQEVVSGLAGSDCAFGVIPSGSGNDFVKSVDIDETLPTAGHLDIIRGGNIRAIDLVKINDSCFANIGSIGIDAQIVVVADKLKKIFGKAAYVMAALWCTMTKGATPMSIKVDDALYERKFTLVAVCNGWNYGGGFKIAPSAKNDDGQLTLCMIDGMSKPAMTVLFPRVIKGTHVTLKQVSFMDCKKAEINFEGTQLINLDGNLNHMTGPLKFEIMPTALNVLVEKGFD
ncbi:MAG: diacylglycerol kinase family lipid kinase [Defluviitaleaceae bacterium]|nr:diacylglycerol kinase family lipid kinase [Defluviitaleaceae bacterium]